MDATAPVSLKVDEIVALCSKYPKLIDNASLHIMYLEKKEVKLLEQTKILLVDTVLGVWIFYNSSGRYRTATRIN
jgi:hypothetical protein